MKRYWISMLALLLVSCAPLLNRAERHVVQSDLPISSQWQATIVGAPLMQPAITEVSVVVATQMAGFARELYGFDKESGQVMWRRALKSGISTLLVPDEQTIFYGDREHTIWRLDGKTGEVLWQYTFDMISGDVDDIVIEDGILYAATAPEVQVVAIDLDSLEILWLQTKSLGYRGTDLFLNGDELIVATGAFRILDKHTGEIKRIVDVYQNGAIWNPYQVYEGHLYGNDVVRDAETFSVVARLKSSTTMWLGDKCELFLPPYTFQKNMMYAVGRCGGLYALDRSQGYQEVWRTYTDEKTVTPFVFHHNILYFLTTKGELVGASAITGQEVGVLQTNRPISNAASDGRKSYAGIVARQNLMVAYWNDPNIWMFRFEDPASQQK